jgi:hypothetical protein
MLFKFRSQATSDLIMLEADGRSLLQIMLGHSNDKGIILAKDLPAVIDKLESAVAQDESARLMRSQEAQRIADPTDKPQHGLGDDRDPVRLAQRASPMLKMLKHCAADSCDLVWGV